MNCKCTKLNVRVTGWRSDEYFQKMNEIGESDDGWSKFVFCPECLQTWLVDEYDKVQYLFGIKIDNPSEVTDIKLLAIHKQQLLEVHGGTSDAQCQMSGCRNQAVNDFALCAECLIQKRGVYQ